MMNITVGGSMFDSLFWMFKTENFKNHFIYLLSIYLFFILMSVFLFFISSILTDMVWKVVLWIFSALTFISPMLCFQGYFWNLTDNIINRQTDIISSNVYNGKVKEIFKIELPEINTRRFIWRGIASIVASLLLCYPFVILLVLASLTSGTAVAFYNFDLAATVVMYAGCYLFLGLFIPALLWNYAKQDSIFAVWNFPKAVHIMGTYTGKYIWNTFLFLVFAFVNYCITTFLTFILGLSAFHYNFNFDTFTIVRFVILIVLQYAISIYWIFVNAYLLGTIAPSCEA